MGFDMTMAIISLALLYTIDFDQVTEADASVQSDWECRSCKMLFFHAMSWFVFGPYAIVYLWIWAMDYFFNQAVNRESHDAADQEEFQLSKKGLSSSINKRSVKSEQQKSISTGEAINSEGYHSSI